MAKKKPANLNPALKGMAACVSDAKAAGADMTRGPNLPTDYASVLEALRAAQPRVPLLFHAPMCQPFLQLMDKIGPDGYADVKKRRDGGLMADLTHCMLQRGNGYLELETLGFEELVSDLYDGFLSAEDRNGIKMPDRVITPPMVKWGNPDSGPYTWPFDATHTYGVSCPVVNMPPSNAMKGLMAWSTIGHETCGHDILHANEGLQGEMTMRLRTSLSQLKSKNAVLLTEYWTERIDETASDVFGILNMGPAAGLGLIAFLRGLRAAFGSGPHLLDQAIPEDEHPADILRGYLAAELIGRLKFKEAGKWAASTLAETRKDLRTKPGHIQIEGVWIPETEIMNSLKVVVHELAQAPSAILNGFAPQDIQNWRDSDEDIVLRLRKAYQGSFDPKAVLPEEVYATHIAAAALISALEGEASPESLQLKMMRYLRANHARNPGWGPLAIAHSGAIKKHHLLFGPHSAGSNSVLAIVCRHLQALGHYSQPLIQNGQPTQGVRTVRIHDTVAAFYAAVGATTNDTISNPINGFIDSLRDDLGGHLILSPGGLFQMQTVGELENRALNS